MKRNMFLLLSFLLITNLYAQVDIEKNMDSIFSKYTSTSTPGLSVGIVKNGELIHSYQRGLANLEYDIAINDQTIFRVASIAKQFTAACIGILVLDKKISINDDVRKYIPELPDYGKVITIKHLLNHTSGIRNYNVLQHLKGFNYGFEEYTNKDVCKLIFQQKGINNIPGEKMLYSNSNYVLLALIVERVAGKGLNDFATENIFHPLEMMSTYYTTSNTEIFKNGAYAYYKDAEGYQQPKSLGVCIGAGGLKSTVNDLAKWSKIFTSADAPYAALSKFLIAQDTLNDGSISTYARGVFVSNYKGYTTIHHSGMDLGLRTQIITVPKEKLSIILLANLESINSVNLSYQLLDLFINPISLSDKKAKANRYTIKELKKFTGDYQEINSDLRMSILIDKDTLKTKSSLGQRPIALIARGKNEFQRVNNASVTHKFYNHDSSEWDMAVDFAGATFYFERVKFINSELVNVADYVGEYYSEELGVKYQLFIEDSKLYLSFPYNPKIELIAGQKDEFGSQDRTRYIFKRDENNLVINFTVASEGTVKDIQFEKNH